MCEMSSLGDDLFTDLLPDISARTVGNQTRVRYISTTSATAKRGTGSPNCIIVVLHRLVNKVHLDFFFNERSTGVVHDVLGVLHPTVTPREVVSFF